MSDRDPAAIHPFGPGLTLPRVIDDHATLSAFPKAGIAGRLARAADTGIIYRDTATTWETWVSAGSSVTIPDVAGGLINSQSVAIPFDGATHVVPWVPATSPEPWLSGTNIIHPGIYNIGAWVGGPSGTIATTGKFMLLRLSTFAPGEALFSCDGLLATFSGATSPAFVAAEETMTLGVADLPWSIANTTAFTQSTGAGSASIAVTLFVWQLAAA